MLKDILASSIPFVTALIILHGLSKKLPVFELFIKGAKNSAGVIIDVAPNIIGIMVAVTLFTSSGAADMVSSAIRPIFSLLGVPTELLPLVVLRPVSGSGSISVLQGLFDNFGVDSALACAGAVILTSTETTLYTSSLYLGSVGASREKRVVLAALCADMCAIIVASNLLA